MKILPFCEFYVRQLLRRQPAAILGLSLSFLAALGACFALWYWSEQNHGLSSQLREAQIHPVKIPSVATSAASSAVVLPAFSSAEFIEQFSAIARDEKIPADELFYVLETGAAQPFWRYRITVDVKTGYPELRKFIAALSSALPNVALDTIRCHREDVNAAGLSCQLAFSAFFKKDVRG